jgi:hypothetical protein
MGTSITSGGIGKKELSVKDTPANAQGAEGFSESASTQ